MELCNFSWQKWFDKSGEDYEGKICLIIASPPMVNNTNTSELTYGNGEGLEVFLKFVQTCLSYTGTLALLITNYRDAGVIYDLCHRNNLYVRGCHIIMLPLLVFVVACFRLARSLSSDVCLPPQDKPHIQAHMPLYDELHSTVDDYPQEPDVVLR